MTACLSARRRFSLLLGKRQRLCIVITSCFVAGFLLGSYRQPGSSHSQREIARSHRAIPTHHKTDDNRLDSDAVEYYSNEVRRKGYDQHRDVVHRLEHDGSQSEDDMQPNTRALRHAKPLLHTKSTADDTTMALNARGAVVSTKPIKLAGNLTQKPTLASKTSKGQIRIHPLNHATSATKKDVNPTNGNRVIEKHSAHGAVVSTKPIKLAGNPTQKPTLTSRTSKGQIRIHPLNSATLTKEDCNPTNGNRVIKKRLPNRIVQAMNTRVSALNKTNGQTLTKGSKVTVSAMSGKKDGIQTLNIAPTAKNKNDKVFRRNSVCPNNFIDQDKSWNYGKCLPHVPSEEACKFAKKLYKLDGGLTNCKKTSQVICVVKLKVKTINKLPDFTVQCNKSLCQEKTEPILVLSVEAKDGFTKSSGNFHNVSELEKGLPDILRQNIRNKTPFVILRCTLNRTKTQISQLIVIDPITAIRKHNHTKPRDKNKLNVNILLLDSVSRAHFYRSLPKTIDVFKTWKNNPKKSPAQVFDFELFQAIEGHTAENTHALFTGTLFPPELKDKRVTVNPGNMFGTFNKAGYQTMWQEDLCWSGIWGLMIDLVAHTWKHLQKRLTQHFIDHTGITHSSCEVLRSYGLNSPFMGPPGEQVCFNGRFQHSDFLQYTLDTIRTIDKTPSALPLLSYMSLSVGHDHIGRRIQTLDSALVDYVNELSVSEDTITIVLSDHGNTYTSYTVSILEGRFEMFHPHLFMIIPNKVARRLGEEALNSLRINQHRLVTIMDLHHSVMALAQPLTGRVRPKGVFAPIPAERTCSDIELRMPNLCVCKGWDAPATNDSFKIALVEFAVGELNNEIEKQVGKHREETVKSFQRSCVRLRAVRFDNVRERHDASHGSLITSLDIYVPAGDVVSQTHDVFHVEIESYELPGRPSMDMSLIHFDRMTMYGKYGACADQGVALKLCVCSMRRRSGDELKLLASLRSSNFLGQNSRDKKINECIFLLARIHVEPNKASPRPQSFAYELANVCTNASYTVSVDTTIHNIKLSRQCPFKVFLPPSSVQFILAARKTLSHWKSKITVNIQNTIRRDYFLHKNADPRKTV